MWRRKLHLICFITTLSTLKGALPKVCPMPTCCFAAPIPQMELPRSQFFLNANKMKVGFGGSWGWQLGKWRGLKVGSNLPISQLGVLKCLARGQTGGSEQAARNIIIKQCIVKCNLCNWTFLCKFSPNISFSNLTKYISGRYIEQVFPPSPKFPRFPIIYGDAD